jgi:CRISPR/Cas system CMR-associated protein Cmr5 small subunit
VKEQFQHHLGALCARLPQCILGGGQVLAVFFFSTLLIAVDLQLLSSLNFLHFRFN